jgi:hypothetical protein
MSSTLYVDKVVEKTSAAGVHISGHVMQVVQSTFGQTASNHTSSSFTATGHTVTITPKFSTSKVLLYVLGGGQYLPLGGTMGSVTIYRGSTNIGSSTRGLQSFYTVGTTGFTITPHGMMVLDSPSTTSATTYQTYAKTDGGTYQYNGSDRGNINFVAMEIAQ